MTDMSSRGFVIRAVTALFIAGDITALDRYWSESYIQHNPNFPNGREGLRKLLAEIDTSFSYEIGLAVGEGDLVMIHGRYTGLGPKPVIAVDIFRVADGKIAEHWDVLQEEVIETASGNPMFDPSADR